MSLPDNTLTIEARCELCGDVLSAHPRQIVHGGQLHYFIRRAQPVTPARAFAVELRSLLAAVKRGEPLTPVDVLERIARAADQFAYHTEHGVPTTSPEQFQRLHDGNWKCCE